MKKKILSLTLLILIGLSLTACKEKLEDLTIDIDNLDVTIIEGETYQITYETNDELGVLYDSGDESIILVNSDGLVTAIAEGETFVCVKSKTNPFEEINVNITVRKLITLSSEEESIELVEGDTHLVIINSNDLYNYSSGNTDLFVVDESGLITAKKEGTADLIVTSTYDDLYEITIPISIEKLIVIDLEEINLVMVVGDSKLINYTANDDVIFESRSPNLATVDENGNMSALAFGELVIRVISVTDSENYEEINVKILKYTEEILIEGNNILISGMSGELTINPSPVGAFSGVIWESNNSEIVTVNEAGIITGISVGNATIIATSTLDSELVDTYDIEVINVSVVDATKQSGDTYSYMDVDLVYGERLFSDINTALSNSPFGTLILIAAGTYNEDITVAGSGYTFEGISDVIIVGDIFVTGDDVAIKNIKFQGNSSIETSEVSNFVFVENIVENITTTKLSFINMIGSEGINISLNSFTNINVDAITIYDFVGGLVLIEKNIITNTINAITIDAIREYDITTEINIIRNDIDAVTTGLIIDLMYGENQKQIEVYARFNAVSNYSIAASSNIGNQVDLTLNYWGCITLDYDNFINISEDMLIGFYTLEEHIITEAEYDPDLPVKIIIVNPITEITIGESYTIEYLVLPLDLESPYIKYITSAYLILGVNQSGQVAPLTSGTATITVRSGYDSSIKTSVTINVITTPGIEVTPSNVFNSTIIGDTFTLNATPFPIGIQDESVSYSSSNEVIATIDASGSVEAISEGLVTFTTSLDSDPSVTVDYTIYVYTSLDENNLLDYLSLNQVSYSTSHSWTAYGYAYNYYDTRYESVSRYYFDSIVIDDSKMLPISYGIRPGELMEPHPVGVTAFNPDNIYWVVVHDTASTGTGSGALSHANYLYNAALAGTELWVSWHYSIDDTFIYQSLPENERGYHAGDGSSLPLNNNPYFGGGNRNGIGIEMAVNDDGDMYRTWQRTAKLVVDILKRNNMPLSQKSYHNDFSGKDCPNTLRNAGLIPLFEEFLEVEFKVKTEFPEATITFNSNNPEYIDEHGRVFAMPERALTVSYSISVNDGGVVTTRTFYTYLPGTVR